MAGAVDDDDANDVGWQKADATPLRAFNPKQRLMPSSGCSGTGAAQQELQQHRRRHRQHLAGLRWGGDEDTGNHVWE